MLYYSFAVKLLHRKKSHASSADNARIQEPGRWFVPRRVRVLVLTRKLGEGIAIGDDIKIIVMQIKGKQVRLGIKAKPTTIVHREEIYQKIHEENKLASQIDSASLKKVTDSLAHPIQSTKATQVLFKKKYRDTQDNT